MRLTHQLLDHLGLAGWGGFTDNAAKPLEIGDQYTPDTGAELPGNFQLYQAAEQLIAWWKALNQTDALTNANVFRERMLSYANIAERCTGDARKSVAFQFMTLENPRTVFLMVWDNHDNQQALFISMRFPDEFTIQTLVNEKKLWRPTWNRLVRSQGMYAFLYNDQCVVRSGQRWAVLHSAKFPDNIDTIG